MELAVFPGWLGERDVEPPAHTYQPADDRATGEFVPDPDLLADLHALTGERYQVFAFQAYRDGSGCDWHRDTPFDAQAILSLGVTRTFGIRRIYGPDQWIRVAHGDLVVMPSGFQDQWQHCIRIEDAPGERVSLVFRTVKR